MLSADGRVLAGKPMGLIGKKKIEILYTPASRIETIDKEIEDLAGRMLTTVRRNKGHAIAANQVGVPIDLVVLREGTAFVNVSYSPFGKTMNKAIESCLSLPGKSYNVDRWDKIELHRTSLTEEFLFDKLDGFKARMWQHEVDHLRGNLISNSYRPIHG